MVLTSGESLGPLLWLNSRMRVRHGGGIWTLVVRRVSNQYLINSGALAFWWRIFHLLKSAKSRTVSYFCRYCETKIRVAPIASAREECSLFPLPKSPMTARCQSPMPPWERISFTACCIWTRINFLIVLDITGIFLNSPVLSVYLIFIFVSRC